MKLRITSKKYEVPPASVGVKAWITGLFRVLRILYSRQKQDLAQIVGAYRVRLAGSLTIWRERP